MSKLHDEITDLLQRNAPPPKEINKWVAERYLGSKREFIGISAKVRRHLVRKWMKDHDDLGYPQFLLLITEIYSHAASVEEVFFASDLLYFSNSHRQMLNIEVIETWLDELHGWAELDSLCQRTFSSGEILEKWGKWEKFLKKLNKDKDIRKRRASLVLLCRSLKVSGDARLANLAFKNIESVKHEKEILITKAVSWVLRELIKHHKKEVAEYLKANESSLPKIALRETRRKLETGRK